MNTYTTRTARITVAFLAALAMTALLPFLSAQSKVHAASHSIADAQEIKITEKWLTVKGTTLGMDEEIGDNVWDYYKFKTQNVPGVTYTFKNINVSSENGRNLWCRIQDAEGEDIYSEEDGIGNNFNYEYGASQKTSTYKLKKNTTYYISVCAYPTAKNVDYRMDFKFSYDKPAKAALKSLKSSKKKTLTVKWSAVANATKYEVAYKVKGGKWKYKKVTGKSITLKKLKSKKKYTVKIRAIRTVAGKTLTGAWSSTKTKKVK